MELVILALTAFNIQNWRFVRVTDPEQCQAIRAVAWDRAQVTDASELLASVKALAISRKIPLRRVLEDALVLFLRQQGKATDGGIKLRRHPSGGKGLQRKLHEVDWHTIREKAYAGRGGGEAKE